MHQYSESAEESNAIIEQPSCSPGSYSSAEEKEGGREEGGVVEKQLQLGRQGNPLPNIH